MANKLYVARETAIVWTDSGGDLALTFAALSPDAVRIGARKDFGAGSTARRYEWRAVVQFDTAPVVGETVDLYLATSDGTDADGATGTGDAAGTTTKLKNLKPIGRIIVDTTSVETDIIASGECVINTRYVSPVVHNNTADSLANTGTPVCSFTLTPIPPEIQ